MFISRLPKWVLVEKFPAFYDFESLTATEQTARVYGKMQELIDSYNNYVTEVNKIIDEYDAENDKTVEEFICRISCLTDNYINTVDMRIAHQDRKIAEVYEQFADDVNTAIARMVTEMKEAGEIADTMLDAISDIEDTVNQFIDECRGFMTSCEQFKTEMSADYQTTKTTLDNDYQQTKTALDSDYQNTKSSLNDEYVSKKEQLENDYEQTKADLNSDYELVKAGYSEHLEKIGVVLYNADENGNISFGEQTSNPYVENIGNYRLVIVYVNNGSDPVVCCVNETTISDTEITAVYRITGSGSGRFTGGNTAVNHCVNIEVDAYSGFVLNNKSLSMQTSNVGETTECFVNHLDVGSIIGLM